MSTKANVYTGAISKVPTAAGIARKGLYGVNLAYEKASLSFLSRAARGGLPKPAKIEVFDAANSATASKTIDCLFRPTQLVVTKTTKWEAKPTPERNVPTVTFSGGEAASIGLTLFFDTTKDGEDVRTYTDELFGLMVKKDATATAQPPLCRFVWGQIKTFLGYIDSCVVTYTFFLPDGTPLRATAAITIKQYVDESVQSGQNPTSYSEARKTWIVTEGDRLDLIAYEEYGNPGAWRHIALVNNLDDPFALRPGQVLKLTPLEVEGESEF